MKNELKHYVVYWIEDHVYRTWVHSRKLNELRKREDVRLTTVLKG